MGYRLPTCVMRGNKLDWAKKKMMFAMSRLRTVGVRLNMKRN